MGVRGGAGFAGGRGAYLGDGKGGGGRSGFAVGGCGGGGHWQVGWSVGRLIGQGGSNL